MDTAIKQRTNARRIFLRSRSHLGYLATYPQPTIPLTANQLRALLADTQRDPLLNYHSAIREHPLFHIEGILGRESTEDLDNPDLIRINSVVSRDNSDTGNELRVVVKEQSLSNMTDVQYVFPGYNMTSRGYKPQVKRKTKFYLSPYRCTNELTGTTSFDDVINNRKGKSFQSSLETIKETPFDGDARAVHDMRGRRLPYRLMTLPPIDDLKTLKRPVVNVKVTVKKKHGKFKPTPVIGESGNQSEPPYRLGRLDPAPKSQVPKALKHPDKMRGEHIPYRAATGTTDNTHVTINLNQAPPGENQQQQQQQQPEEITQKKKNRRVSFSSDTLSVHREVYAKTPPPKLWKGTDDHHSNSNASNNNTQLQLPRIKVDDETDDQTVKPRKPILVLPRVVPVTYSQDQGQTKVKLGTQGTMSKTATQTTNADLRESNESLTSPRHTSTFRGHGQGHGQGQMMTFPPTWEDNEDFEDYLKERYPQARRDFKDHHSALAASDPGRSTSKSKHRSSYHL